MTIEKSNRTRNRSPLDPDALYSKRPMRASTVDRQMKLMNQSSNRLTRTIQEDAIFGGSVGNSMERKHIVSKSFIRHSQKPTHLNTQSRILSRQSRPVQVKEEVRGRVENQQNFKAVDEIIPIHMKV